MFGIRRLYLLSRFCFFKILVKHIKKDKLVRTDTSAYITENDLVRADSLAQITEDYLVLVNAVEYVQEDDLVRIYTLS